MNEYTPTTEEVRKVLARITPANDHSINLEHFDRWLRQVQAEAWDEGRNALPVYGEDHDVYCSEYECHCDLYTNPYRQGETK